MKRGITRRLFLYIILVVVGFAILILCANTLLLRPLYYQSVQNSMLEVMDGLDDVDYSVDEDVLREQLRKLTVGRTYDVVIKNEQKVLFSTSLAVGLIDRPKDISRDIKKTRQSYLIALKNLARLKELRNRTFLGFTRMPNLNHEVMVCTRQLPDVSIFLTQPIEPIDKSIEQANILLMACTILSLGIAGFFIFKTSKRFTQPIREIQQTVGEVTNLNFGHRCDIRTGDELENLGRDVNRLSDKLRNALSTLRRQNEQLEKDILTQKRFISNASHELRTPLSLIKGYADEMNIGYVKESDQKDTYIRIIVEEAEKMNRLLKEMLELSRMESGKIIMQNKTLSVSEQIQTFVEKYEGFISDNELNISFKLEDDAVGVFDPMRFEQILANYISNAAKYGDDVKKVRISTEVLEKHIRISVFNTGKPISKHKLSNLWNGFYKANTARTRVKDSYGLGLSIVKAIQNVAGQAFGVKNVEGGVIFWFDVRRDKS